MRGHPFGLIYMRLSFAGRNSELEQLRTLHLQGRHVLIVGPPGIGKTALLNELRALRFWFVKTPSSSPAFAADWSRSLAEVITGFRYSSGNVACWPTSRSLAAHCVRSCHFHFPAACAGYCRRVR